MSSDPSQRDARWRRLAVVAFGLAAVVTVSTVVYNSRQGAAPGAPSRADGSPGPAAMGRPGPMSGTSPGAEAPPGAPHELGAQQIAEMTQRLAERLEKNPNDADGWAMLARSHAVSGNHAKAVEAFRKAAALRPDDPVLLADFADALAMTQQRSLAGEPITLVMRALKLAPDNLKLLSLAGTEAFNRQDYATAVRYWETLQSKGGADSVFFKQVQGGLDEARQLAKKP